jgi:CO dehydrogenase/acetyl-CoA synthase alpha subunit
MTTCPVAEQAELTASIAQSLAGQLRKLRRLQNRCRTCSARDTCEQIAQWNTLLATAITAINHEWEQES